MYGRQYVRAFIKQIACYELVSIPLSDARSRPPQLSCESIFDSRGENQLVTFMSLLQHFSFAMNLRKELSIV